ncbi:ComEA family DNA-binding protein [Vibrio hepatarius]|jgi:competence protein ComEA|uniref:Transporter n=1 Tax=Vibrio hepatarius TaxID=171383 RepID=A0A0M0I2P5_9VIBR|nr:ComEA family DNA-binding protein [Vibrio hepatarius]KOO08564.1 transporter [Vibrio hepatarius]NOI13420.1 helix-hairpin-helix domain-containing protein [Vibrio hepatarius]
MMKKWLLVMVLMAASPFGLAESGEQDPKYQGIEITVNVNQASAQELADLLVGIGTKKAEAIVEYRNQHGKFENVDALVNVKGIGEALLERNRDRIKL